MSVKDAIHLVVEAEVSEAVSDQPRWRAGELLALAHNEVEDYFKSATQT